MFTVYILYSATINHYYVGYTGDEMQVRLGKHLSKHKGFTAKAKDWAIVHTEAYPDKQSAMKREREIKKWKSTAKIKALIASLATKDIFRKYHANSNNKLTKTQYFYSHR